MSIPKFENGWEVPGHDYQAHSGATADHGPTTVVYKRGGSSGQLLATETITYDANNNIATRSIAWEPVVFI